MTDADPSRPPADLSPASAPAPAKAASADPAPEAPTGPRPAPSGPGTDPDAAPGPVLVAPIALKRHVIWLLAAAVLLGVDTELQLEAIPRWRSGTGGSALLLLVLWAAFLTAARWVLDERPLLTVGPEGVEVRLWGLVPWEHVAAWELRPAPRGAAFVLEVGPGWRSPRRPRLWPVYVWGLPRPGARRLTWPAVRLGVPVAAVAAAARAHAPERERRE